MLIQIVQQFNYCFLLKPLHDKYKIKRVIVSTYQAVSGAGKASADELFSQTKDYLNNKKIVSKNFTKQIAFNLIPHIDDFCRWMDYTKEEWKMENETKKILDKKIGFDRNLCKSSSKNFSF